MKSSWRKWGGAVREIWTVFRFTLRDGICLGVLATLGGIVLAGSLTGGLKWWYYPAPGGATGVQAALWTAAFVLLAAFPLIFDAKEAIQWRASRSRT